MVIGEREAAQQGADWNFGAEQLAVGNKRLDSIAGKFSHRWKTTWNKRYKTFSTAVFVWHRLHGWRRWMDSEIDVVHLPLFWEGGGVQEEENSEKVIGREGWMLVGGGGGGVLEGKDDRKRGVDVGVGVGGGSLKGKMIGRGGWMLVGRGGP